MWVYEQSTGRLWRDHTLVGTGYAGHGAGKNNPALQFVHNVGPLPCGGYTIQALIPHAGALGRDVLPLVPDPTNDMRGRDGFYCHGDSADHPGAASDGCIVQDHDVRLALADAVTRGETRLTVVTGPLPVRPARASPDVTTPPSVV